MPDAANCSESSSKDPNLIMKKQTYGDCNKPNLLFRLEKDGTLRHNCSGKIVCPDSTDYLFLKKNCPDGKGKYERLAVGIFHGALLQYSYISKRMFRTLDRKDCMLP